MDHLVMYRGRQVAATHLVTITVKVKEKTELLEWEKGIIRGFIFEEIESCYDVGLEKLFFYGKAIEAIFCVFALNPYSPYFRNIGEPCSLKTLETGILMERFFPLDREMKEKIPFIEIESMKIKARVIF